MSSITLYRHPLSGHSHRVELFLSILGLNASLVDVDLSAAVHKQPDFLAMNRFGQVPVLVDGNTVLSDSNAILVYLAKTYDDSNGWLPDNPAVAAEVQRFLSVAAGQLASGPAAARLYTVFKADIGHRRALDASRDILAILDAHLADRDWLAGSFPTIADLANYTYLAHAPEGGVDLSPYTNVRGWLRRIESLEGFVPMQATAAGLAA